MINEIYKILDDLHSKETITLACNKGCAACCIQLIPCTMLEWEEIKKYIKENRLKDRIKEREKKNLNSWERYRSHNINELRVDGAKALRDWSGVKCIFLNNRNACDIYPVRPMNCRVMSSTSICKDLNNPDSRRFRWKYEKDFMDQIWKMSPSMMLNDLFLNL